VTIAAGFYFNGGIILCADTQETIEHSKTWTPKLRLEPAAMRGKDSPDDLMLAIAEAGDGPFIDKLTERAWESIFEAKSFDEACSSVEETIKSTHEEYGRIFQPGYLPFYSTDPLWQAAETSPKQFKLYHCPALKVLDTLN